MKKKLRGVVLAALTALAACVLAVGLAVPAMAEETVTSTTTQTGTGSWTSKGSSASITVKSSKNTRTFRYYQVFAAASVGEDGSLSDPAWGVSVNTDELKKSLSNTIKTKFTFDDTTLPTDNTDVTKLISALSTKNSGDNQRSVAKAIGDWLEAGIKSGASYTVTDYYTVENATNMISTSEYDYTLANVSNGYYLLVDVNRSSEEGEATQTAYSEYLLKVKGNSAFRIKLDNENPTISKKVDGAQSAVMVPGDTKTFTVTVADFPDVSAFAVDNSTYEFQIIDKMSKGLTLVENNASYPISIQLVDPDKVGTTKTFTTSDYTMTTSTDNTTGATTITFDMADATMLALGSTYKGWNLVLTYSATVSAIDGSASGNTATYSNEASLKYSNDPKNPSTPSEVGPTNTSTVKGYSAAIDLFKTSDAGSIEGAVFTVTPVNTEINKKIEKTSTNFYRILSTDVTASNTTHTHTVSGETVTYLGGTCTDDTGASETRVYWKSSTNAYLSVAPTSFESPASNYAGLERVVYTKSGNNDYTVKTGDYTAASSTDYYKYIGSNGTSEEYVLVTQADAKSTTASDWERKVYGYQQKVTYTWQNVSESSTTSGTAESFDVTTNNSGHIELSKLGAGTYTFTEKSVPGGYTLLEKSFTVKIEFDAAKAGGTGNDSPWKYTITYDGSDSSLLSGTRNSSTGIFDLTVTNTKGSTLPTTGGIGTTIFYVVGGVLVVGAVVLLITKRRMSASE